MQAMMNQEHHRGNVTNISMAYPPNHHTTSTSCCRSSNVVRGLAARRPVKDSDVAKELTELTVQERERIYEEIHGVAEIAEETPEFLSTCFAQLKQALDELPRTHRPALERAFFLQPSLETDDSFRLMFLRADNYDAFKAARRIAKYFEDKLWLFGENKLVKKITLQDFNEEDMEVFRSGFFMILPKKDSVGRPIWFCDVSKFDFARADSALRCSWYQVMACLEDEATQLKGVSDIQYCLGNLNLDVSPAQFYYLMTKAGGVLSNLPVRVTSYHFCYNNIGMRYILEAFLGAFGRPLRLRLRTHYGSAVEIRYSLLTFGIACPFLLDESGVADKNNLHKSFIENRLALDRNRMQQLVDESECTGIILYPNPNDVLVGRGRPFQTFSGNRMFADLIDRMYLKRFMQMTDRFEKTCMLMDSVKTFQESVGGRFLERTPIGWKVVSDQVARKKATSSFRTQAAKKHIHENAPSSSGEGRSMAADPFGLGGRTKRSRHD